MKKEKQRMKWVLIVAAVLVGLPLILATVGMMLPKEHVASRKAKFKQSPETIWATITNFAELPSWRGLKKIERLADLDGKPVWIEYGSQDPLTYQITMLDPPRKMVTTICDKKLPYGGNWAYEISPTADGCTLTLTENGEIYNPLFRVLAKLIFGYHSNLDNYLKALGKKFGEDVILEPSPAETNR